MIDKLASLCAPHDTLYLDGRLDDLNERNTVVSSGALIAYLKSDALRSLKRDVEAQAEFEKIEKLYPQQMLLNGRAGAYAALQSANNLLHQTHGHHARIGKVSQGDSKISRRSNLRL